jgi:hypothetical protein
MKLPGRSVSDTGRRDDDGGRSLRAAHAAEKALGIVAMDAIAEAVRFLMVDPVHREPAMQLVPRASFVSVNFSALGDPSANEEGRSTLGARLSQRAGAALPRRALNRSPAQIACGDAVVDQPRGIITRAAADMRSSTIPVAIDRADRSPPRPRSGTSIRRRPKW